MLVRLTIGCITLAAITACADTDPRYGPPGVIRGLQVDFEVDSGGATGSSGAPGGDAGAQSSRDAKDKFAELFATLGTCSGCHGANQTPVFMKATAEETRALWKGAAYDKLPTSAVYNKPQQAAAHRAGTDRRTEGPDEAVGRCRKQRAKPRRRRLSAPE